MNLPFAPIGATVTISATSVTSNGGIGSGSVTQSRTIRIAAPSTNSAIAFVTFGNSAITATTAGMPILPGTVETFFVGSACTHVAAITASGTATLYVTPGEGA